MKPTRTVYIAHPGKFHDTVKIHIVGYGEKGEVDTYDTWTCSVDRKPWDTRLVTIIANIADLYIIEEIIQLPQPRDLQILSREHVGYYVFEFEPHPELVGLLELQPEDEDECLTYWYAHYGPWFPVEFIHENKTPFPASLPVKDEAICGETMEALYSEMEEALMRR